MFLINEVLVSEDIINNKFLCDLNKCKGACCWEGDYGAPLESDEIDKIKEEYNSIKSFLDDESVDFINEYGFSRFYEGLKKQGTQLLSDGRCVFMTKKDGIAKCGIEKAFEEGATDFQKPISCHLYPIRIDNKRNNGFLLMRYDQWNICEAACKKGNQKDIKIYEFLREAIIRRFGEEFYEQLLEMIEKFEKKI